MGGKFFMNAYQDLITEYPIFTPKNPWIPHKPVVLEIGCYKGLTLKHLASSHPESDFVGLDLTLKRGVLSYRRTQHLNNVKVGLWDAIDFLSYCPDHSFEGMVILFPDPWPKNKHSQNRLLGSHFFFMAKRKLVPNGYLWIKTDEKSYYESIVHWAQYWRWGTLPECPLIKTTSSFENLFTKQQKKIYESVFSSIS